MSKAIVTIPATETMRYSGLIGEKEKAAITGAVACPVDEITPDRIDRLLTWDGQQTLRRGRNIGSVAMHRIRLWLAFHPNRRAWEAASGKLYDELNKMGIDPDQPAEGGE